LVEDAQGALDGGGVAGVGLLRAADGVPAAML
jgi:hypothetical protein